MEGQSNYRNYLYPDRPLASGTIDGFEMYDLGSFPGIVQGNEKVKGELFAVTSAGLADLDRLEGNGSLYNRKWTEVSTDEGKKIPAYVYIYNGVVDGLRKIMFDQQPYGYTEEEQDMAGNDVFAHVISYIVKEEPESADDLLYAFELVKSRYEDTERKIRNSIHLSVDSGDYNTLREQTAYCEEIQVLISEVDAYLDVIVNNLPAGRQENTAEGSSSEQPVERERIDYGLYATDRMEEHSLTENFEHTRPCAFSFMGNVHNANSWQDILVQVCGLLAEMDLEKMKSLTTAESMQGRKLKYITYQAVPRKTKRIPGTDLHVWINNSANTIAQLIVRLLKEYDMNENVVKVYLRADYSPLHQE